MTISAITFDFHNTLAQCDKWFQLEVYHLIPTFMKWYSRELSIPFTDATGEKSIALYRTIRKEVMATGIEKDAVTCVRSVASCLGYRIDDEMIDVGLDAIMRPTLEDAKPMPGAIETVHRMFREGYTLAVISSAIYHPFLEWTLDLFEISNAFDAIFSSARLGVYKSSPEIYTLSAKQLGISPIDTVHIGDSHEFDAITAARAGMKTILIASDSAVGLGSKANFIVSSLNDVAPHVIESM